MLHFLHRFINAIIPKKSDTKIQIIEKVINDKAHQLQAIDPETNEQWWRLRNTLEQAQLIRNTPVRMNQPRIFKPALAFAIAAVVLCTLGILWIRQLSPRTYETTRGEHTTVFLNDSTEVTLNSLSELKVQKSILDNTRRVTLKGEGLFHVRKNGTSFILSTDVGTVKVLGTRFNVRARNGKMEVAVLEGTVQVSSQKNGLDSSIVLTQGQYVACLSDHFPGSPGLLPFPDYPGWLHGKFMFYRSDLISVCKEIESQFNAAISIQNPNQQNITITGVLNGQSVETALTTLTQLTGNTFRYENGTYIIY